MNSPSVRRAVLTILRLTSGLETTAAARQLEILKASRVDLIRALAGADAQRFRTFQQTQLLAAIDAEIAKHRAAAVDAASEAARTAFGFGQATIDDSLAAAGIHAGFGMAGASGELLSAVVDVTSDQIRSVWSELGTTLKGEVRRASLGIVDAHEAMIALQTVIKDSKTFGSVATRAETIIRTEVNRTYGLAGDDRLRQSNKRLGGGLKKYWLSAGGSRTRASHLQAGKDYAQKGVPGPIPVDQPFMVGRAELMFPLDPRGPAEEVINCRCRSVPYVGDLE